MAALNFPTSPALNQIYTANGKSWRWDGTAWKTNNILGTVNTASQYQVAYYAASGTTISGSSNLQITGTGVTVAFSTASSSIYNGAFTVIGGAGIGQTLNVGGSLNLWAGSYYTGFKSNASSTASTTYTLPSSSPAIGTSVLSSDTSGNLSWVPMTATGTGGGGAGTVYNGSLNAIPYYPAAGTAITGSVNFTNTGTSINIGYATTSSNSSSGALIVTGGVGIGQTLFTSSSYADSISGVVLNNGVITSGSWAGNAITGTYGGTGYTTYTLGDILSGSATGSLIKTGIGLSGQVLTANPSQPGGLGWASLTTATTYNYGSFIDTTTQTVLGANIATPIYFNTTIASSNVNRVGSGSTTWIQMQNAGTFNIQFSAQLNLSSGTQPKVASIWLRKNGVDVPDSTGYITVVGKDNQTIAAWNYVDTYNKNDYFELYFSSSDANMTVQTVAAGTGPTRPESPSMILTVVPVDGGFDPSADIRLTSLTGSTSFATGALTLQGGLGVSKSIYSNPGYFNSLSGVGISNGVITTGAWAGSVITAYYGGTGIQAGSFVTGSLLFANSLNTWSNLNPGVNGYFLVSAGTANTPVYTNPATLLVGSATTATYSHQSGYAITSGSSALATTSIYSNQSGYAITSGTSALATTAIYSNQAGYAVTSGSASIATTSIYSNQAGYGITAGTASIATTSTYAHQSGYGITAGSASIATTATYSHQAGYAITSGNSAFATTSSYAHQSGYGITAGTASIATTSTYSHQAGYAITSGSSSIATTATYSHQAGYAITSGSSSTATTATNINVNTGNNNIYNPVLFTPQGTGSGVALSTLSSFGFNPTANILSVSGLSITASTSSISTSSGALIVSGGVGIGGSLYTLSTANSIISGVNHINGFITSGTWAGSLITAFYGGTGIQAGSLVTGALLAAGSLTTWLSITPGVNGYFLVSNGTSALPTYQNPALLTVGLATTSTYSHQSGYAITSGSSATASTATYAIQSGYAITAGSTGLATTAVNINVNNAATSSAHFLHFSPVATGSGVAVSSNTTLSYNPSTLIMSTPGLAITATTSSTSTTSGSLINAGGLGLGGNAFIGGTVNVTNTTAATGVSSAALVVSGGMGVNGDLFVANIPNSKLSVMQQSGDEGGEIFLNKAATNTTITTGVTIDIFQNRLRFFEQGGTARGFYLDITTGGASVGTNIMGGSSSGTVNSGTATYAAYYPSTSNAVSENANLQFTGTGISIGGNISATSTTTGSLKIFGGVGIGGSVYIGGMLRVGTDTFTKNYSQGDILLDNGTTDTPAIRYYWANNKNFGTDVFSAGAGSTKYRIVRDINETGGIELFSVDTTGSVQIYNVSSSTNYSGFKYSGTGGTIYTLPQTSPATGTSVLQSDSSGVMTWVPMTAGSSSGTVNSSGANFVAYYPSAGSAVTGNTSVSISGTGLTIGFTTNSANTNTGALTVAGGVGVGGTLWANTIGVGGSITYAANNVLGTFSSSVNGFNQVIVQNKSNGSTASADFVISNDVSTDSTFYGNFGMNSSGFTGSGSFNLASAVYLSSTSGDLVLGSTTANLIRFVYNSGTTDSMQISGTGVSILNTTSSTSTNTGALIVSGGVGIGGSLYTLSTVNSSISGVNHINGVITSGSWSATAVTAFYGGTGLQSPFVVGDLLYANTTSTWSRLAASSNSGYLLASAGTGATPVYTNPLTITVGTASTATYAIQSGYAITSGSSALATTATNINVNNATTAAAHFIHFSPAATGSGLAVSSNTTFSYNPSTLILSSSGVAVTATTNSNSTTSGALTVVGGVGIGGSIFLGSQLTQTYSPTTGAGSDHAMFLQSTPLNTTVGAVIQMGSATAWDGITAGFFTGSVAGTYIGINAGSGSTASAIDFQVAGSTKFHVGSGGSTVINAYTEHKSPDINTKALRVVGFSSTTQGDILSFEHPAGGSFTMNGNASANAGGKFTIVASSNATVRASTFAIQASDNKVVINVDASSGAGALSLQNATNLQLYNSTNAQYAGFKYTGSATTTYTLPASAPGAGVSVLQSDTSGVMSWVAMAAAGGGSGTVTTLTAGTGITFSTGTTITTTGTIRAKRPMTVSFCAGYTPAASGVDSVVIRLPDSPSDGVTSINYKPQEFHIRVETASATATTIQLEKYTGTSAFSGTAITSVSIVGASTYENQTQVFAAAGSLLTSGDKLRINFTALSASHANFSVYLELEEV